MDFYDFGIRLTAFLSGCVSFARLRLACGALPLTREEVQTPSTPIIGAARFPFFFYNRLSNILYLTINKQYTTNTACLSSLKICKH